MYIYQSIQIYWSIGYIQIVKQYWQEVIIPRKLTKRWISYFNLITGLFTRFKIILDNRYSSIISTMPLKKGIVQENGRVWAIRRYMEASAFNIRVEDLEIYLVTDEIYVQWGIYTQYWWNISHIWPINIS